MLAATSLKTKKVFARFLRLNYWFLATLVLTACDQPYTDTQVITAILRKDDLRGPPPAYRFQVPRKESISSG
jgi:hypothetical protein